MTDINQSGKMLCHNLFLRHITFQYDKIMHNDAIFYVIIFLKMAASASDCGVSKRFLSLSEEDKSKIMEKKMPKTHIMLPRLGSSS